MTEIITAVRTGVPDALEELAQLGRTLWRRRADVLAYFDDHASNGPTEAINGLHCGNLAQRIRCALKPEEPRIRPIFNVEQQLFDDTILLRATTRH